jgi:hypothetical protein
VGRAKTSLKLLITHDSIILLYLFIIHFIMKQLLPRNNSHRDREGTAERLRFACAWCPLITTNDCKYTHGMCKRHKREFIASIKSRIASLGLHRKDGTDVHLPRQGRSLAVPL